MEAGGPGFYYTDASGGCHGTDRRLRRCGWGLARINVLAQPYPQVLQWACGPLPVERQSVPRGELNAVVQTMQRIEMGPAFIFTDSQYVFDGSLREHEDDGMTSSHQDLWAEYWRHFRRLEGNVALIKVKAHCSAIDIWSGRILPWHFFGNHCADRLALRGAKMAAVPEHITKQIQDLDKPAWNVQARLLQIMDSIMEGKAEGADDVQNIPPAANIVNAGFVRRTAAEAKDFRLRRTQQAGHH